MSSESAVQTAQQYIWNHACCIHQKVYYCKSTVFQCKLGLLIQGRCQAERSSIFTVCGNDVSIVSSWVFLNTITHERLHLVWWIFASTCTSAASGTLLNFKAVAQKPGFQAVQWIGASSSRGLLPGRQQKEGMKIIVKWCTCTHDFPRQERSSENTKKNMRTCRLGRFALDPSGEAYSVPHPLNGERGLAASSLKPHPVSQLVWLRDLALWTSQLRTQTYCWTTPEQRRSVGLMAREGLYVLFYCCGLFCN